MVLKTKLRIKYKFNASHGWTLKKNEPNGIDIHDTSYITIGK
jgi:hypothetical protein